MYRLGLRPGRIQIHNLLLLLLQVVSKVRALLVAEAVAAENAREIVIQIEIAVEISNAFREMAWGRSQVVAAVEWKVRASDWLRGVDR